MSKKINAPRLKIAKDTLRTLSDRQLAGAVAGLNDPNPTSGKYRCYTATC